MFNKKYIIALESLMLLFFLAVFTFSMSDFDKGCKNLYDNMLRLHVIANSDSEEDQRLKLIVRDEILKTGSSLFDGTVNTETAREILQSERKLLENTATETLRKNGSDKNVSISLTKSYFNTRKYDGFTVPAGFYNSLLVEIGEAKGRNWWCVMFPPLCIPAASEKSFEAFDEDGKNVLNADVKIDARFKVVEIYHSAKKLIKKISK